MKTLLPILPLIFSLQAFAAGDGAVKAYADASHCYKILDKKIPQGWDRCIAKFQSVADNHPDTRQAHKAQFSVARLTHEKYEVTGSDQDLQKAVQFYNRFLRAHPKSSMADDALYRIGVFRYEVYKDKEKALRAFRALIDRYPYGDMAVPASKYLQKLNRMRDREVVKAGKVEKEPEPIITIENEVREKQDKNKIQERNIVESKEGAKLQKIKKIKTIVIDPGHGGEDTGAVGHRGTKESVVALQIARKLAFKLKKEYGYDVHLTRTNNRTVTLDERNEIANKKGADLFISVHANSNKLKKIGGVQTFYLNNATNEAARLLAVRENRSSNPPKEKYEAILNTMLQNANTNDSRFLAHWVHKTLMGRLKKNFPNVKDLDIGSAVFQVLFATKCPSILVETSYISNPDEELRLRDSEYQWAVAEGVAEGVRRYAEQYEEKAYSSL